MSTYTTLSIQHTESHAVPMTHSADSSGVMVITSYLLLIWFIKVSCVHERLHNRDEYMQVTALTEA